MFLSKVGMRPVCAFSSRALSKAISSLVVISVLAVSMPGAPRMLWLLRSLASNVLEEGEESQPSD